MANSVDAIKKIDKELEVLSNSLKSINEQIIGISKNAREVSGAFNNVKTPKDLSSEIKKTSDNTEALSAIIKEREATERKLISTIARKALVQDKATKQLTKENEELKLLRREQRNQLKTVSNLSTAYEKLSSTNNILIRRYQDLSVRQAKGIKLTEREERRLNKLGQTIQRNQNILKKTDAEVGRFQRNVGNYASGFDGLGNSIAQLTREAPAFAVSLQTGFLALSNNIPILADEISRLNIKNKELAAQGEPTKNVFKSIGAAVFSFQTLLSAGVLILTLYGDKIVGLIDNAISGAKGFNALEKSQESYNEAVEEGIKNSVSEIAQLQLLLKFSADATKSTESRNKAVNKLIKNSGGLIKEQDRLNILNGESLDIENKLTKAILNRAIVQALQQKVAEELEVVISNSQKIRENEIKQEETIQDLQSKGIIKAKDINEAREEANQKIQSRNELQRKSTQRSIDFIAAQTSSVKKFDEINSKTEENTKLKEENNNIQSKVNELIKSALKLTDDYTLELDENTKSITKRNKAVALSIELAKEREKDLKIAKNTLKALNELFKDDTSFKLPEIDQAELKEFTDRINKAVAEDLKIQIAKDDIKEGLNDLANTIEEFTGVSGDKFLDFFDKITEKGEKSFEDLADIAASSFSLAGDVSNAFFQGRIDGYQRDIEASNEYYANLLENENLTDEERGRLELDRQNKEKELRKKQAKEKEKQFQLNKAFRIGEIIADTAASIIKTGANLGYPAAIPFQIQAGILGAAQLAIVAAQPVPKFAEGGEMTHDGLMMINDHSSGRLEVVERDGKLLMTNEKNAIVEGKKGDIIHKDAKEYFNNLSDGDILKNTERHAIMATLQNQKYLINKLDNKRVVDAQKVNTDRIIKAIKGQKTKFNVHQNISLVDDLKHLNRLNDTL